MSRRFVIEVIDEDIQNGERASSLYCPIALASQRAIGTSVYANGYGLSMVRSNKLLYTISQNARNKMRIFDRSGRMKPFRFVATPVTAVGNDYHEDVSGNRARLLYGVPDSQHGCSFVLPHDTQPAQLPFDPPARRGAATQCTSEGVCHYASSATKD